MASSLNVRWSVRRDGNHFGFKRATNSNKWETHVFTSHQNRARAINNIFLFYAVWFQCAIAPSAHAHCRFGCLRSVAHTECINKFNLVNEIRRYKCPPSVPKPINEINSNVIFIYFYFYCAINSNWIFSPCMPTVHRRCRHTDSPFESRIKNEKDTRTHKW